jgi:hypothetical protein
MVTDPRLVGELRTQFRRGATPTALIRRVVERHEGEPMLDRKVRDYFRVAFDVPVARIGPEMVETIRSGGSVPALNDTLLHRMIEARPGWDTEIGRLGCWLDAVTATAPAALNAAVDPQAFPELTGSWDSLDDTAKECIRRLVGNARGLHEQVNALAVLAEHLQQQVPPAVTRRAG